MADLTKPTEAAGFVASWREHYRARGRTDLFIARMHRIAAEQRANLEAVKRAGGHSRIKADEYESSVAILEHAAADSADASRATFEAASRDAQDAAERRALDAYLADVRRRHKVAA